MKYNIIVIIFIILLLVTPILSAFQPNKKFNIDIIKSPSEVYQSYNFIVKLNVTNERIFPTYARVIAYLKGEEPSSIFNQVIGISDWKKIDNKTTIQFSCECIINDPISGISQGKIGYRIQTKKFLTKLYPFDGYPGKLLQNIWPNLFFNWKTNITIINPLNAVGKIIVNKFSITLDKDDSTNESNINAEEMGESFIDKSLSMNQFSQKEAIRINVSEDKPSVYIKIENKAIYNVTLKIIIGIHEPSILSADTFSNSIYIGETIMHIGPEQPDHTLFECKIPVVTKTGTYSVIYKIMLFIGEDEFEYPILTNSIKDFIWINGTEDPLIKQIKDLISDKIPYISFYIIMVVIVAVISIHIIKGSGGLIWEKLKKNK